MVGEFLQSSPGTVCRYVRYAFWYPKTGFGMTDAPERYKQYASECLRIAQQTTDEAQKARLIEMADAWRRLAEAAAKHQA